MLCDLLTDYEGVMQLHALQAIRSAVCYVDGMNYIVKVSTSISMGYSSFYSTL
jgi:hypothetical protein